MGSAVTDVVCRDSPELAEAIHVVYSSTPASDKDMRDAVADALGWVSGFDALIRLLADQEDSIGACWTSPRSSLPLWRSMGLRMSC